MARYEPLTTQEVERIKLMHSQGATCTAISKDIGRGKTTVSKYAAQLGLRFNAERTAPATANRVASNQKRRAELESRLLDEAGSLLDQLHRPHLAYNFGGKDNTYEERELPEPDVKSKKDLIQAASTAVTSALKLADADRASSGAEAGKSMVGALFAALAVAPVEEPDQ